MGEGGERSEPGEGSRLAGLRRSFADGMTNREIRRRLKTALASFVTKESELLERNAGEPAIATALVRYLAAVFPHHDVDPQYNRHGRDRKSLNLPPVCRGGGRRKVIPDIVIHRRDTDDSNLLVIEIKKETNPESRACDRAKLRAMREQLGYQAGVLLDVPPCRAGSERPEDEGRVDES